MPHLHSGLQAMQHLLLLPPAPHRLASGRSLSRPAPDLQRSRQPETTVCRAARPKAKGRPRGKQARKPAAEVVAEEQKNGSAPSATANGHSEGPDSSRVAVAAKITAARVLARKLVEEKQASMTAAKLKASHSINEEESLRMKEQAEKATEEAAREVARHDVAARSRVEAKGPSMEELQRIKEENEALLKLVLEISGSKREARQKLAGLKEKYQQLEAKIEALAPVEETSEKQQEQPSTSEDSKQDIAQVYEELAVAAERMRTEEEPPEALLRTAAEAATSAGTAVFVFPPDTAQSGCEARLYYNRLAGPLPGNPRPAMKAGLNKWETLVLNDMSWCGELQGLPNAEWWSVGLELPQDVFQVDFVVVDNNSGIVDNNSGHNYTLPLLNAKTEEEVARWRAKVLEEADAQRLQHLQAHLEDLWQQAVAQSERAGVEGRQRYREQREAQLRDEAELIVLERRAPAVTSVWMGAGQPGVFTWLPGPPAAGQTATFAYNKALGPLRHAADVVLHIGYDGWWQKDMEAVDLRHMSRDQIEEAQLASDCEWWSAEVEVPNTAAVLDYVLSDSAMGAWDNNGLKDFHTAVAGAPAADRLADMLYSALQSATAEEDSAAERRAGKRAAEKVLQKARSAQKRLELQWQKLYTQPATPVAGQAVQVFYNPDATPLRGRPDIWMRGSWNRWSHPECFMPEHMKPTLPGGIGFLQAEVQVPPDAAVIDVVFSDTGDLHGGFYDNNRGLDYHIPTAGARGPGVPRLHVVHVTVEMAPIAKVGGMGDVVTALGRAVQEEGHAVSVILPKYDVINYEEVAGLHMVSDFFVSNVQVKVWKGHVEGLETIFLEPVNGSFWVGCIYGRNDDAARFGFFCQCATDYMRIANLQPDIVHCHDWPTAPIMFSGGCGNARGVFTIHNLNYGADLIGRAMQAAAVGTTVSPTYAAEVSGHPAVAPFMAKFYGIINGIDTEIWSPAEDRFLPRAYGPEDVAAGKAAAKAELRQRMNLCSSEVPLVAVVTRLTHQKGVHLIKHAAWRTLERGAQFVLLGSAPDPKVQGEFNALAGDLGRQYPDRARLHFAYDEPLSHLIYAGADMLLVPSMFEPCGLTQMIAMRYGTIPVVRKTGGLNDTVFDLDHDAQRATASGLEPNGFSFEGTDPGSLDYALNRALSFWYTDHGAWVGLQQRVMQQDWSWATPALDYIELYYKALKQ